MDFSSWDPTFANLMATRASVRTGQPSAIQQLLASLTQPPPQPGAAMPPGGPAASNQMSPGGPSGGGPNIQVGNMTAPPVPNAPPLDPGSVMSPDAVKSEAGIGIGNKIRNLLTGDAPNGFGGLLTPEEQQRDKPGLLQSIMGTIMGGPFAAQMLYERNLGKNVDMNQLAGQIQATNAARMENARILSGRQKMGQLFPQTPGVPASQQKAQLIGMYNYAVSNGDTEMAKDIGARMNDMFKEQQPKFTMVAPGTTALDQNGKPVFTNPARQSTTGSSWFKMPDGTYKSFAPDQEPPKGAIPVQTERTNISLEGAADRAGQSRLVTWAKQFDANIKPLADRAAILDQAMATIDQAAHDPNPATRRTLYTSAIANFVQAADQKSQLRYQLLKYYEDNVDPSIKGRWDLLKDRLLQGQLPQYTMNAMLQHIGHLKGIISSEIQAQRDGMVKRHPLLDGELRDVSEFFPMSAGSMAAPQPGAGGVTRDNLFGGGR